ncbi:MAG: response regulator transcription factor [Prolixibacteraceae bacterium]|jgi:DNA-binding LytR/AlgR family response regulator|nr:response regulator transcription factor [Prolixibacteraceae bacterium]MBT6006186.1 response regulator transcription factor [Prolixibacteraceae bacterium]MBT6765503.1 response regulator transcription factor [Prolixibacteraceae bacterium]MBT6997048.1 response regulator transcription factor [Prolixibacteraceae bacterium]MBT7396897.1 response regulator transcription factor [Prolixibacteraceae bacterium]
MKTKCLVVDDEPLARDLMRNHIEKLENFEIVAECGDAMKALQALRTHQVDLMFMDIQMPQITGIEFLKTLKHPPKVIITTAYREYAIDGFELDVVDYLLKPITFERFLKSVNKYYQLAQEEIKNVSPVTSGHKNEEEFIYVKENKKVIKVHLNEILYVEGLSEYVQIYTEKKKIITKTSMTNMGDKLPDSSFLRIHKSFIVSLAKIEAFTSTSIEVPGKELPIGRSYKNSVLENLQYKGNGTNG